MAIELETGLGPDGVLIVRMPSKPEVASFVRATFRSVWALELLCLLRQNRERTMSHADMVGGLRASDLVVTQSVAGLAAAGLVLLEEDGTARYAPATSDLDLLVGAAEKLYAGSPDAVRRMIVEAANPGLTAFADAFRLRKE